MLRLCACYSAAATFSKLKLFVPFIRLHLYNKMRQDLPCNDWQLSDAQSGRCRMYVAGTDIQAFHHSQSNQYSIHLQLNPALGQSVRKRRRAQSQEVDGASLPQILQGLQQYLVAGAKRSLQHLARPQSQAVFAALNLDTVTKRFTKSEPIADSRHQADLRQLFDSIDSDRNGRLDQQELQVRLLYHIISCCQADEENHCHVR